MTLDIDDEPIPPQCYRDHLNSKGKETDTDRYLFGIPTDKENSHPNMIEQPAEGRLSL